MKRTRLWAFGTVVALAGAGAATYSLNLALDSAPRAQEGAPAARPVPVTSGLAAETEFPIYRLGLGTVQAYNTVTVRVRVDGEVQKIAFREGQDVKEGDLLAQIDPRPLQAPLRQAEADKARDEALLANAARPAALCVAPDAGIRN